MTDQSDRQLREIDRLLDEFGPVMEDELRAEYHRRRAALRATRDVETCGRVTAPAQLALDLGVSCGR